MDHGGSRPAIERGSSWSHRSRTRGGARITGASAALLDQLRRDGYGVVPDVIPTEECTSIRESVIRTVQDQRSHYPAAPKNVGFTPGLINHDQSFATYLASEQLLRPIEELLGHHSRISFTSAIINEPGNDRGKWHADWPFNQRNAGHIPVPYPDAVMHITTLWMLSSFTTENGGTLIRPGSHRQSTNPTAGDDAQAMRSFPDEINVTGPAGGVLVMDSRLWHATAPNRTDSPRVALAVRYAPWWLNLEVLRPESDERKRMCDEAGRTDNIVPSVRPDVYARLPQDVQTLYRHWVARGPNTPDKPV